MNQEKRSSNSSQQQQLHQTNNAALSLEQLQNLSEALQAPLTGRSVLVPFGTKAFLPGILQPELTEATANDDSGYPEPARTNNHLEERVYVRLDRLLLESSSSSHEERTRQTGPSRHQQHGNAMETMSRHDALELIQTTIQARQKQQRLEPPMEKKQQQQRPLGQPVLSPGQLDAVSSVTTAPTATAALSTANKVNNNATESSTGNNKSSSSRRSTSYFEIREEIDSSGAPVSGEAIDVSRQLEFWQNQQQQKGTAKNTNNENGRVPPRMDTAIDPAMKSTTAFQTKASSIDIIINNNNVDHLEEIDVKEDKLLPLSKDEYSALSARLDQLALLEEQADQQKESNAKSSKSLQSKGWSKGFFQKKNKPLSTKTRSFILESKPPVGESISVKGARQTKEHTVVPPPNGEPERQRPTPSVVSFAETNQIQEIPRIGNRSVSNIPKPSSNAGSPRTRQPLDSSLFPGLVQEHDRSTTLSSLSEQQQHQKQSPTVKEQLAQNPRENSDDDAGLAPQPALSRFAQQRQQARIGNPL